MKKRIWLVLAIVFCIAITPTYKQSGPAFATGFPFEASNSRARFAQVQSIVDHGSWSLTRDLAEFSSPDVLYYNGKYLAVFVPGVSLLAVPWYVLGQLLGQTEFVTFLLNGIITVLSGLLIIKISLGLGAGRVSSIVSGAIFIFGTNALSYASTLTQHPLTTLLILGSIATAQFGKKDIATAVIMGYILGWSILADIPNPLFFFPAVVAVVLKYIKISENQKTLKISIDNRILGLLSFLPSVAVLLWFNINTTGSMMKPPQLLGRTLDLNTLATTSSQQESGPFAPTHLPLNTQNQIRGIYTLVASPERSWLYYSPIVVLGITGLVISLKKDQQKKTALVILSCGLVSCIVYLLFGDPWGGWSFGPRYLIPAAAVFCTGIGVFLERYKQAKSILLMTFIVVLYSVAISVAGAITTNLIPPKIEAVQLSEFIDYTYRRNFQLLFGDNFSKSAMYSLFSSQISPAQFYLGYLVIISTGMTVAFAILLPKNYDH